MLRMNNPMKMILEQFCDDSVIPAQLSQVLDQGFMKVGDCIFLRSVFSETKVPSNDFITKFYKDLSGYEYSINKIHIETTARTTCSRLRKFF